MTFSPASSRCSELVCCARPVCLFHVRLLASVTTAMLPHENFPRKHWVAFLTGSLTVERTHRHYRGTKGNPEGIRSAPVQPRGASSSSCVPLSTSSLLHLLILIVHCTTRFSPAGLQLVASRLLLVRRIVCLIYVSRRRESSSNRMNPPFCRGVQPSCTDVEMEKGVQPQRGGGEC